MTSITLLIIAKTHWAGKFCYLGYDPRKNAICRPVMIKKGGEICPLPREKPLEIGQWYKFRLLSSFQNPLHQQVLPHSRDDVFVKQSTLLNYTQCSQTLYSVLRPLAQDRLTDIYHHILNKRYVHKGTDCPSVGVLNCQSNQLRFYKVPDIQESKNPYRMKIRCLSNTRYDLAYTAEKAAEIATFLKSRPNKQVLVLFSTARPWSGKPPDHFSPERCTILVVGLVSMDQPKIFYPSEFISNPKTRKGYQRGNHENFSSRQNDFAKSVDYSNPVQPQQMAKANSQQQFGSRRQGDFFEPKDSLQSLQRQRNKEHLDSLQSLVHKGRSEQSMLSDYTDSIDELPPYPSDVRESYTDYASTNQQQLLQPVPLSDNSESEHSGSQESLLPNPSIIPDSATSRGQSSVTRILRSMCCCLKKREQSE